ncbi:ATP-dependent DNA helicase PIF4 [Frankliniella fusca]|uniref:ATP-dependent DNA helicase PIF4 n=1 Tax=Frankliniella fusca TaxID=407009 RepID=A0AAE1LB06_9NEOP|nr:ATP-dependent DNA helicase PIF4 [Frankliniella fusca]
MDEQEKLTARKLWSEIKEQTEIIAKNNEDCSFDEYLAYLNLDEQSYIQALRSKLKRPTVFLGRNLNERRVNAYNKEMLILWEAHMDIQLVVSPYGCVKYIVSYVSKSQKGMSKLLKEVADKVAKEDEPTIKKLRKIVNAFLNNCEISAQEIALHVLGIPMSKSSIGTIYINTCPPDQRVFLKKEVDLLEEDEENEEESTIAPQFKILDLNETPSDFQLEIPHTEKVVSTAESMRFPLPNLLPECEFLSLIKSLNEKQRKYLLNLTNLVKTNPSEPFYHFLSGGAGVGKSKLINAIKQVLERFWVHQPNNKPEDINILAVAPTGKAAIGINGTTIDSAFGFGFNIKDKLRIGRMLNSDTRNTLAFPDGISNGSPCILNKVIYGQLCEKNSRERIPIRAYVQFEKESTGEKTRQRLQNIIKADGIREKNWTPIQRICRSFSLNDNTHIQVTRNQLPLLPSNAQTIHCSQSCTYDNILVFLNKNLSRKLLYTACSRVTSLTGLYLSGIYKKPARATLENDPALKEMTRMRDEAQLQFSLIFPEDVKNQNNMIVLLHNVRSLNLHFQNISCDPTFIASDIIMLAETWSKPEDKYDINNFTIISRTDCKSPKRKGFGTLIYAKNYLSPHVKILFQNESISGTTHFTIVALTIFNQTVMMVYKSPKAAWDSVKQQLQQAITMSLQNQIYDISIMGDFNIKYQVSDHDFNSLTNFMKGNNCFMILDTTKVSTDHNSLIDLCFSTNEMRNAHIFESAISDHKPIWIELSML